MGIDFACTARNEPISANDKWTNRLAQPLRFAVTMRNQFPSVKEHAGFYNLDSDSYRRYLIEGGDGAMSNHQTTRSIPPLSKDEVSKAVRATYECFWKQAQAAGLSLDEAESLYSFAVHGDISDRTLQVLLPEPEALTPEFVQAIQEEVLRSRPLWRVLIRSEEDSRTVIVYPEIVRVGLSVTTADWKTELNEAATSEMAHHEATNGHHRRQIRFLSERVKLSFSELADTPFKLMAVFDNYRGNRSSWTVWILFRGENSEDITVEYADGVASSDNLSVRDDGYFGQRYKSDAAKHWLRAWVYPAGSPKLTVKLQSDYRLIPGMVFDIEIEPESVIRDTDLGGP